ncbi:MAG: HlyD family type I secretion periplasmic adaptor subunit [Geminicoccaceae bacterium]
MQKHISGKSFEKSTSIRPALIAGTAIGLLFFGGLGTWASTAPLVGAAIAPGVVAPASHRKTVQHLEGGIISEILVKDGDKVKAGQPLFRLDGTQSQSELAEVEARWYAKRAELTRLMAEQAGQPELNFPADLMEKARTDPYVANAIQAETRQAQVRASSLASQIEVLERRAAKEEDALAGLEVGVKSYAAQRRLTEEEIDVVNDLLKKGLERKPRLLTLLRTREDLDRASAASVSEIERAKEAAAEARQQIDSTEQQFHAEVAEKLAATQTEVRELQDRIDRARDRMTRTVVVAPVDGTAVDVRQRTIGGVIHPGDPLVDIVPLGDELILEARVSPNDIDDVGVGQAAIVHLTAYRQRHLPRIDGVVTSVSADRMLDQRTNEPYFAAKVKVDPKELEHLDQHVVLTPGMPAEVMIVTKERTMLDYLLAPLTDTFRRGMRED